jgi:mRNA interferase MazF
MHTKDFIGWNVVKQETDNTSHIPTFSEREVWWCKIGINVGHEADGKNCFYNRPVLIVKKFNSHIFWGVAMTTKQKEDKHYFLIDFQDRKQCIMLSHLRLYSSKRLQGKAIGKLGYKQFESVRVALKELL